AGGAPAGREWAVPASIQYESVHVSRVAKRLLKRSAVSTQPIHESRNFIECGHREHVRGRWTRARMPGDQNWREPCALGADDIPLRIVADEYRFARVDSQQFESTRERRGVRLPPADVDAEHRCVDKIEQPVPGEFRAPGGGRAPPRRIRDNRGANSLRCKLR